MKLDLDLEKELKFLFGFSKFKGEQKQIILNILNKKSAMVIMPTGAGKSLCFQLPALLSEGTALVVSPLIALMKNQVDVIRGISSNDGIAHVLNSSLNNTQIQNVKNDISSGITKLLYVAPESLAKKSYIEFLSKSKISFLAVDEAHCISEWGHDFRPEYRNLNTIIKKIKKDIPIIALTATATPKVKDDIIKNLGINKAKLFNASFNRPNLFYEVRKKTSEINKEIIFFIKKRENKSGIIYCLSRKSVNELSEFLQVNGVNALPYHAGLEPKVRVKNQDMFLMEECDVIVATIAFGMGIDKPDVRFVIHYDIPKSLESYYQETGRAGRDGGEGHCLAFYSYKDIEKLEKFMSGKPLAEQEQNYTLLDEMAAYSETSMSRRKFLLNYFGEEYDEINGEGANMDDNMRTPKAKIKVNNQVLTLINLIVETKEQYRIKELVGCLVGNETNLLRSHNIKQNKFFGIGKDHEDVFWNSLIRHMLVNGMLSKVIESYGIIKLNESSMNYLINPKDFYITENHNYSESNNLLKQSNSSKKSIFDKVLFSILIAERKKMAKSKGIPPYAIFQESSIEEMAIKYPVSINELKNIIGVGEGKAIKFGGSFVILINEYVEENNIVRPDDLIVKTTGINSALKLFIIQSIDRKLQPIDIADSKGIELADLIKELETIVFSGTKLNINYMIDEIFDEDQQEELYDYFIDSESDDINIAIDEFDGDYEELDLKLYRIKFINDVSN
ncbi:MAG: ATP-dependent DNA helicase RecQ [Cryomorphaceae bacterium]|nr:MAG: ATP-dependent DNA helicase RecQ [Cryomorphaceae bacterium]